MPINVDLLRVAADRSYALQLSLEQWSTQLSSKYFIALNIGSPEAANAIATQHAAVNCDQYQVPTFNNPSPQLAAADLKVIGQPRIRTQGFGVVTGIGNYVEN